MNCSCSDGTFQSCVLLAGSASLLNAACYVHFVLQTRDLLCVCVFCGAALKSLWPVSLSHC
jgi:hypothetical protein